MPGLHPFPSCCGCDIISAFEAKPTDAIEYQKDPNNYDRWGNNLPLKDENGQYIPLRTARDGLIELIGTKSSWGDNGALPDRGFICILAQHQLTEWMPTLKELGFEFLCQWNNSVHGTSPNYLFVKVKHNGTKEIPSPREVPPGWDKLPEPDPEKVKKLFDTKPEYLNGDIIGGDADEDLLDELDEEVYYDDYDDGGF
jgi:hypothetical protein